MKELVCVRKAADAFMAELWPGYDYGGHCNRPSDRTWHLVLAAFCLYREAWQGTSRGKMYRIESWRWPYTCLEAMDFPGDEPWTVLLRRALELRLEEAGLAPAGSGPPKRG